MRQTDTVEEILARHTSHSIDAQVLSTIGELPADATAIGIAIIVMQLVRCSPSGVIGVSTLASKLLLAL